MIKQVRLENFKCFQEQTIKCAPITFLSGLNGMGKSSVIQSLLLLRQSYMQGMLDKEGLLLNGDLVRLGTAQDVLCDKAERDIIAFEIDDSLGRGHWEFKYNRVADILERGTADVTPHMYQTNLFTDNFQYLQAERTGPRPYFEMSDFMVRQRKQLGTLGEYAAHFLFLFGSDDIKNPNLGHPNAVSLSLKHQTEAWLSEVSPGTRINVTSNANMDIAGLSFSFATGKEISNEFRSTNVGFGLTYTLPIILALLSAEPNALLAIENPEAHLHPRGQARLGGLIARAACNGIQILFETHSDHVLNGLRLAVHAGQVKPEDVALHFFCAAGAVDGPRTLVVSPIIDKNGRIDEWPDGFFDEWDKSLESLITTREA